MTREELVAYIERDIAQKGGARVPMGVIREALAYEARNFTTFDAALEEFARSHGWRVRPDDDLPTLRFLFSPVEGAGKLSKKKGKK